jgi:copper chaperone NosL
MIAPFYLRALAAALLVSVLAACGEKKPAEAPPPPAEVSDSSIAEFCHMALFEHPGPKGQIFVKSRPEPFWFASVRDTFAFTMLPEEPKDIAAVYVNDMGKVKNWDSPEPGTWIDAHKAFFVIESRKRGGMGEAEAIPFSDEAAAAAFVAENGGRVVRFDGMPRDYILPAGEVPPSTPAGAGMPSMPAMPAMRGDEPGGAAPADASGADGMSHDQR